MSADAEKLTASMAALVTRMVQPALVEICARTEALIRLGGVRRRELEVRVRELEVLAGIESPAVEPEAKALPRMRWDPMHSTWRASA